MSFDAIAEMHPRLTLFSPLPAIRTPDGMIHLDERFVTGMNLHARDWPGPVTAVMRDLGTADLPFARPYDPDMLGFNVSLVPPGIPLEDALVSEPGVVMVIADIADHLPLARAARRLGLGVVLGIERTLASRLRDSMQDRKRSVLRRLMSVGWNLRQERRLRRAMREADGIQMNGYPVSEEYLGLNRNTIRFMDNRMRPDMIACPTQLAAKPRDGGPLRLIHSGRLEPHHGAQKLIPLAAALRDAGVSFTLTIEGKGSLSDRLAHEVSDCKLDGHVRLVGQLPFETGLVPMLRDQSDLLVSTRLQPELSGVFLEAMACGLPVLGYDNSMLSPLVRDSDGGWTVPMDDQAALVQQIARLDRERPLLSERAALALAYARSRDFESEFSRRTEHLRRVFVKTRPEPLVLGELLRGQVPAE